MPDIVCDECGVIGESSSVIYLPEDIMNKHSDEKHGGKEFGYSCWKE